MTQGRGAVTLRRPMLSPLSYEGVADTVPNVRFGAFRSPSSTPAHWFDKSG
jgi:hypothetical protein